MNKTTFTLLFLLTACLNINAQSWTSIFNCEAIDNYSGELFSDNGNVVQIITTEEYRYLINYGPDGDINYHKKRPITTGHRYFSQDGDYLYGLIPHPAFENNSIHFVKYNLDLDSLNTITLESEGYVFNYQFFQNSIYITRYNTDLSDMYVEKYDFDGNRLEQYKLSSSGTSYGRLYIGPNGEIICHQSSSGSSNFRFINQDFTQKFIEAYPDRFVQSVLISGESIFIAGGTTLTDNTYLTKLDYDGNIVSSIESNLNDNGFVLDLKMVDDKIWVLSNQWTEGKSEYYIHQYDSSDLFQECSFTINEDQLNSYRPRNFVVENNSIFITSGIDLNENFHPTLINIGANCDHDLPHILSCIETNTFEENTNDYNIKIYPNPAKDYIHLDIEDDKIFDLEIRDIKGQLMLRTSNSKHIKIEDFTNGQYFIFISDPKNPVFRKVNSFFKIKN